MCTVTWLQDARRYRVYFNRDERRTRSPAHPPSIRRHEGVDLLSPTDPDGGGSWMAANREGIAVCLLNYYEAAGDTPPPETLYRSRGGLVLDAAAGRFGSIPDPRPRDLEVFPPFHLMAFSPDGQVLRMTWDGRSLARSRLEDNDQPVTTSSFRTADVLASRASRFRAFREAAAMRDDAMHRAFHLSREGDDAFSVMMSRPDARTVSLTVVDVSPDKVHMTYFARGDDDTLMEPEEAELRRG